MRHVLIRNRKRTWSYVEHKIRDGVAFLVVSADHHFTNPLTLEIVLLAMTKVVWIGWIVSVVDLLDDSTLA